MNLASRARVWVATALGAVAVVTLLVGLGVTVPTSGIYALAAAVVLLAVGASIYDPMALPVLAMPVVVVVMRVGGASVNLSLSDFALFGVFWVALLLGPRPLSRPLRNLIWLSAFYQLTTLFTVVANPYTANAVEWFHEWLGIAGVLVVGWAIGRSGHAKIGLSLYLASCLGLAVLVCVAWVQQLSHGDSSAVYLHWPYEMQKNYIGDVLGIAAAVVYARPRWLGWSRKLAYPAFWLLVLGIAASQSRQAVAGLGVAIVILALRRRQGVRHTRLIFLGLIPAAVLVVTALNDQLASGNQFNSAYQRLSWFQDSLVVWNEHQWFGAGLRWWYTDRTPFHFQPPNAEFEVLSSAGTIGLIGFVVMAIGTLIVLWRVDPRYGTLAFAVVAARLAQGQLDLFWVSVQTPVPFLIAAICLGVLARSQASTGPPAPSLNARDSKPEPVEAL